MDKKQSPVPISKLDDLNKTNKYSNSLASQRARILDWLQQGKTLTTLQARAALDILHPGGRVLELRRKGWNIKTHWQSVDTLLGRHRVAKYFLAGGNDGS